MQKLDCTFNKRLLMHEIFKGKKEFETHGVFYNSESLADSIKNLETLPPVEKQKKFEFQFQKDRLLEFLK
jgi:hypothetical protein